MATPSSSTTLRASDDLAESAPPPPQAPVMRFASDFIESKTAVFALALLVIIILAAMLAPWLAPQDPYDLAKVDILDGRQPPGGKSYQGFTFWLGSDGAGRDLVSAILYGLRISLTVGILSGLVALVIGASVGLLAAYAGGRTESFIMRLVDLQLSLPAILVALMLVTVLGKGVDKIIIALIIVQWAYFARTARATALSERGKEYVEAATCLGLSHTRILFRHILPNCMPPLIVVGTMETARAVALEATLSFLGVGLPQTEPSLGLLISNGHEYMLSGKYWISFFPGIALLLTIVTLNLVGDRLRDVMNPRLSR